MELLFNVALSIVGVKGKKLLSKYEGLNQSSVCSVQYVAQNGSKSWKALSWEKKYTEHGMGIDQILFRFSTEHEMGSELSSLILLLDCPVMYYFGRVFLYSIS